MNTSSSAQELIKLLARQEESLGQLYHHYANIYPDSDFWEGLSKEEYIHQSWVLSLSQTQEVIQVNENKVRITALGQMISYIESLMQEQKKRKIKEILTLVLNIEKSLLEKNFFQFFQSDSESIKRIFTQLFQATEEHVKRVEIELSGY